MFRWSALSWCSTLCRSGLWRVWLWRTLCCTARHLQTPPPPRLPSTPSSNSATPPHDVTPAGPEVNTIEPPRQPNDTTKAGRHHTHERLPKEDPLSRPSMLPQGDDGVLLHPTVNHYRSPRLKAFGLYTRKHCYMAPKEGFRDLFPEEC